MQKSYKAHGTPYSINCLCYRNNPPLFPARLNGKPALFFLDSGSSVSLVSSSTLSAFGLNLVIQSPRWSVKGASGNTLRVIGETKLNMKFDVISFLHPCIVTESHTVPGDFLLGHGFLWFTGIVHDPRNSRMASSSP